MKFASYTVILSLILIHYTQNLHAGRLPEEPGYRAPDKHSIILEEMIKDEPSQHTNSVMESSLNSAVNHDSNITQLPDGEISVLGKGGAHSIVGLKFKFHRKPKAKEKMLNFLVNLGQTRYFDPVYRIRDSQNITLGFDRAFKRPKTSKFMMVTVKANYRFDFLYAFGQKDRAFETTTTGVMAVVQPKKIKNRVMDILIPVVGFDLERRNFKQKYGSDAAGNSKDGLTPSLTGVLLTMKKHKTFISKTMLMLNIRDTFSGVKDQEYLSTRFGLSWTASVKQFDFTPDVVYSTRIQSSYQGGKRDDQKYETGIACKYKINKKRTQVSTQLRFAKQYSNLAAFEYNNTRFAIAGSHKF